ncbi:MAG: hypothetical protein M3362_04935 [Acidobacteriota bacterium]|nr:hypothetical protein [Acidobacteriota bacterium]
MKTLNEFIADLVVGEPSLINRMRVTPVFTSEDRHMPYLELDEALKQGAVKITEVSEGGSVPLLEVSNLSDRDVIILDGEELLGAKQNRIVNTTIIVPAKAKVTIPVSCVEQSRWRYTSREFSSSRSLLYPSLRSRKSGSVTESLRRGHGHTSDQSEIWGDIRAKFERMESESETSAMSDMFESSVERHDEELRQGIPHRERQVGFLAFINGGFAGGDLFGSPDLCRRKFQKLLRSYYLDALDTGVKFPALTVEQIFEQIRNAPQERFESVGKGTELRFETDKLQGAWVLVDEFIPHLMMLPKLSDN